MCRQLLAVLSLVLLLAAPCAAQQVPKPKLSPFLQSVYTALADKDFAKAKELIAAADAPQSELAAAHWALIQRQCHPDKPSESIELLKSHLASFPDHAAAASAWIALGKAYGTLGQKSRENAVSALEKGLSALEKDPAAKGLFIQLELSDARRQLSWHYIEAKNWKQSLVQLEKWEPASTCGTCERGLRDWREVCTLLTLAHLGQHEQAARLARKCHTRLLPTFTLIRLYEQAGQLHDLKKMFAEDAVVLKAIDLAGTSSIPELLNAVPLRSEADTDEEDYEEDSYEPSRRFFAAVLQRHIAFWRLLQDADSTGDDIIVAARKDHTDDGYFQLLAAIDSPKTREVLLNMAVEGSVEDQHRICSLMYFRMKDGRKMVAAVRARVPADRKHATGFGRHEVPFTYSFFAPWPALQTGPLPREFAAINPDDSE